MMKKALRGGIIFFLICSLPASLWAEDYLSQADRLYNQGGLENYQQAIELYKKAAASNPEDFETNWKYARALREYGDDAKKLNVDGWKKTCAQYGKLGMQYGLKATEIAPENPAGHYYYGLSVGVYSDGVSILRALNEGLKDKTQNSFEKAYALDKMFREGGPMLSLGRFWAVLPWPLRNRKKSLVYYREYQTTQYFETNTEAQIFLAELLIQMGGQKNKTEAKAYLEKATQSDDKYFSDWADRLLPKVK